jgi:hypothetical protein
VGPTQRSAGNRAWQLDIGDVLSNAAQHRLLLLLLLLLAQLCILLPGAAQGLPGARLVLGTRVCS